MNFAKTFASSVVIAQPESSFAGTAIRAPVVDAPLFAHARHLIAFVDVDANFVIVSALFPEALFAFASIRAHCVHTIRITRAHLPKCEIIRNAIRVIVKLTNC